MILSQKTRDQVELVFILAFLFVCAVVGCVAMALVVAVPVYFRVAPWALLILLLFF